MPLVELADPTNCWPHSLQKFADALVASATFRQLVGLTAESDDEEVAAFVFGKRLTHSRSGRTWTRDDLENLRHYAMVQSQDYGKHRNASGCMQPHGATCIFISRVVPEAELVNAGEGQSITDAHDRAWQNIAGQIADEVAANVVELGGPWPINSYDLSVDAETPFRAQDQQGKWQDCEFTYQWGREQ